MDITFEPADRLFETGDFAAAHSAYQRLAQAAPDAIRAQLMAATALLRMGELDASVRALQSLIGRAPAQPLPHYRLAVAQALRHRDADALTALEGALDAGFRQPDELTREPAFTTLRAQSGFAAAVERAARNQHPCAEDPVHRELDFWIGTWQASTPEGVVAGVDRVEAILGGAALVEHWTSTHGYAGTSLNRFDPVRGWWAQTWVDDQGDVLEFTEGRLADGAMRFVAHAPGRPRRLTFHDRGPDALRQVAEVSTDDGTTWTVEYDLRYRRIAPPDDDGAG